MVSFLPEFKSERVDPETAPHVLMGAASPLWLMFGGAAAAGAAWWWWSNRWREAVNLEALMALAPEPVAPSPAVLDAPSAEAVIAEAVAPVEAVVETVSEAVVETTEQVLETAVAANDQIAEAVVEVVEAAPVPEPLPVTPEPVVETVETAAEALQDVAEAAAPVVDDLTQLVGIGPKLAVSLSELGVTSFAQIAAWSPEELQSIDQLLNLKGRADRDAWVAQAKRFASAAEA